MNPLAVFRCFGELIDPFLRKTKPPRNADFAANTFSKRLHIVQHYRRHRTLLKTFRTRLGTSARSTSARLSNAAGALPIASPSRLSRYRREDSNSRMIEQARITDKDLVCGGIHNQSVCSVMSAYLIQQPVCVWTILLNYIELPRFSGCIDSVQSSVKCN